MDISQSISYARAFGMRSQPTSNSYIHTRSIYRRKQQKDDKHASFTLSESIILLIIC